MWSAERFDPPPTYFITHTAAVMSSILIRSQRLHIHWIHFVQFQVIANMNLAYKQEKKKNAKRKTHVSSMALKMAAPPFAAGDSPSPKKLKDSLYLSFPVETVLATEQGGGAVKPELAYHLAESDIH